VHKRKIIAKDKDTIAYNLWVIRQYFPALPYASLNTRSLHPGVAQIPDIPDADEDGQPGLCAEKTCVNWVVRGQNSPAVI